jgi:CDP-diacylglycerol--glycerol-3-phosphate 3-phosphatidyltransferase
MGSVMFTMYSIKPRFQKILSPLLPLLANRGVTPNQITIFTTIFSIMVGCYLCTDYASLESFWILAVVLLVRMAFNAIDGMLARTYRLESSLGWFLNEIGDIVSDMFLYLPFLIKLPDLQMFVGMILILIIVCELAGLFPLLFSGQRRNEGPMGKSDRALYFGMLGLCLTFSSLNHPTLMIIFGCAIFCLLLTIYLRLKNSFVVRNDL